MSHFIAQVQLQFVKAPKIRILFFFLKLRSADFFFSSSLTFTRLLCNTAKHLYKSKPIFAYCEGSAAVTRKAHITAVQRLLQPRNVHGHCQAVMFTVSRFQGWLATLVRYLSLCLSGTLWRSLKLVDLFPHMSRYVELDMWLLWEVKGRSGNKRGPPEV